MADSNDYGYPDNLTYDEEYYIWRDDEYLGKAIWSEDENIGDAFVRTHIDEQGKLINQVFIAARWVLV